MLFSACGTGAPAAATPLQFGASRALTSPLSSSPASDPRLRPPLQVMLPLFCATRAATVVLALAEVAATKNNGQLGAFLAGGWVGGWVR